MKALRLSILPLLAIVLFACKSEPAPPPEPLIERNEEVREYIDVMGELVDEYCTMVEKTMDKAADIDEKEANGEDASFTDALDLLSTMTSSALKIKKLSEEIEEMEADKAEFEKELSAEDYEEFLMLSTETLKRFYDIAKKAEEMEE